MRSTSPIWTSSALAVGLGSALGLAACGTGAPPQAADISIVNATVNAQAPEVRATNIAVGNDATGGVRGPVTPSVHLAMPDVPKTAAPPREAAGYRAIGTEPFWSARIAGEWLTVELAGEPARRFAIGASEQHGIYRFAGNGVAMTVRPIPCSDGMSDFTYADTVQLAIGPNLLKGCGGARRGPEGEAEIPPR